MDPIQGTMIWALPKPYNSTSIPDPDKIRLELPNLIRFKGAWYCVFHEGLVHAGHPAGKARIIRTTDGVVWETAKVVAWDGGDVWDSRFSITAEGDLMLHAAVWFVSKTPRADGQFYQLDSVKIPKTDAEKDVALQSVSWLSSDGCHWSGAYACPTGINSLKWDVVWHNGMGYSVGYFGREGKGSLFRTRDGKSWRVLRDHFLPDGQGNEAALAFSGDNTAYCVLRAGPTPAMFGVGKPPYYQEWTWRDMRVSVQPGEYSGHEQGGLLASTEFFKADLGGPALLRLADGRLLAAGRVRGPQRPGGAWRVDPNDPEGKEDGRLMLFLVDPEQAVLTKVADIDGTGYAGVVEHEGLLWVAYTVWWGDRPGIYLAKVTV